MKKVLSIVLSIAMVVCLAPTMAFAATTSAKADAAYSDTKGTACEGAVNVLSALGVVDGFTDGTYKPEQVVTRAQMAKLIVTALGVADYASAKTSKFTDMSAATWAIPYVEYASNLNIVNGVGNNKFNPNGNVTYEQAATMIVRALGYTDKCNEMNGTWPAIYIQKATALGLFNDVTNKGATGATRGDLAIMLYNALNVKEVYADNDGATQDKKGADGDKVTMMDTLNVNGRSEYKIVTNSDADTAVNSIAGYVGAAAEVIYDKNDDVIALSDIKTTFLSGEFKSSGKFEADNGTTYTIASDAYKEFKDTDKGTVKTASDYTAKTENKAASGGVPGLVNNVVGDNRAFLDKTNENDVDHDFTLAATVSGKTITGIYSIASWTITKDKKVDSSELNQITKNKQLLNIKFAKNDDQEIDNGSYILNGVASLSDIKADNIVYVYAKDNKSKNDIARIDVGTKTVTGKITKNTGSKVTIDGTAYEFSDAAGAVSKNDADFDAGNEVTLYLDYDGKIYDKDLVDGTSGNFAVVVATSKDVPSDSNVSGTAKIELLTADGDKVFPVNGKKYVDNKSIAWNDEVKDASGKVTKAAAAPAVGTVVKYSVNDKGEITKLITPNTNDYTTNTLTTRTTITKAGYVDGKGISDSALIFTVPVSGNAFDYSDTDELGVTKKANVLDSESDLTTYVLDNDTNKVIFMIIDDSASSDDTYGVVTSTYGIEDNNTGADFYVGSEKVTDAKVDTVKDADGNTAELTTVKKGGALYLIKKTSSGSYNFTAETAFKSSNKTAAEVKNDYVKLDGDTTPYNLYKNVVVYVYDKSEDEYSIGSTSDLTDLDVTSIKLYKTETSDTKDDAYGLVNYIVITMN